MLTTLILIALARQTETIHVSVEGVDRQALVFLPATPGPHPPMILGFHGHMGNMRNASRSFRLQEAWPEAIVVYPQGLPTKTFHDPAGNFNGWSPQSVESNKDVQFIDVLYAKLLADYHPDPTQVFAMGHSNGAQFMYILWSLRGSKFAAFGSCEGSGGQSVKLSPKPFFITIGDQDLTVPPSLQKASLAAVFKVNGSRAAGTSYGENGQLYAGVQSTVLWEYQGGHRFPSNCVPTMVKFFQGLHLDE